MSQEIVKADIVFRVETGKYFNGQVFALFPHDCANPSGDVTCYTHIGQHASADYNHAISHSRMATPEEYADLKAELEGIGYEVNVMKKRNYDKYLISYYTARKFAKNYL